MGRTAPLTSKRCILCIYSTNIGTEYFKHALYFPFFSYQNAVCFVMLTCLVPVLVTFYIQDVLKLKKNNNSGAKGLVLFCQKDKRVNLGIFQQSTAVSDMREQWTEGCFHILPVFSRLKTLYLVLFAAVVSEVCLNVWGRGGGIDLT